MRHDLCQQKCHYFLEILLKICPYETKKQEPIEINSLGYNYTFNMSILCQ